mgnify:CR=1 FL=1
MPFNYVNGTMVILVDDSTGTARNLGTAIDTCSPVGKDFDELEVTTFADTAERFIAGIEKSRLVTLGGPFNSTVGVLIPDNLYSTLLGTIQTVEFAPAGTASGKRKITGEFLAKSYNVITVNKVPVRWEAVHRLDGTINNTGTY